MAKAIWSDNLRQVLKREHGKGWSVRDHRGRVQLTRIFEDRSRSAVYLPLTWTADNATAILNTVAAIHSRANEFSKFSMHMSCILQFARLEN